MSLREDLIRDEGVRLKPYQCTAGRTTIGIGRNLDDVGITEAEAYALLDNDIIRVTHQLEKEIPWIKGRSGSIRRALGNMVFQLGIGGLLKFKNMLACLERRDYEGAKKHAKDSLWYTQTPERAERVMAGFIE